jgi:spermidine/putrescine transport system substrate-binding protein
MKASSLKIIICFSFMIWLPLASYAQEKVVNIYGWGGELPSFVLRQFTEETGIKVNLTTYANNETMYAKLSSAKKTGYDIVMPTSFFVAPMHRLGLLEKLDKIKLSNWKNLNPQLLNPSYDPGNQYTVPHIWGATGIFFNNNYYTQDQIKHWSDLWNKNYKNQLLLLDDARAVFNMGLLSLGYSVNDRDPEHIKAAFLKLKMLMKNVKVFSTDNAPSIMLDEDATIGLVLNGDTFKASQKNRNVKFVFPKEGFGIWVDNFSILKDAPHKDAAYAFINFILRADIAKAATLDTQFATANLAAKELLPAEIRNDTTIYPSEETLRHGEFQNAVDKKTLALYEKYWEELKMGG